MGGGGRERSPGAGGSAAAPPRLGRDFLARPAQVVAPELIGCTLVADRGTADEVVAVIVEVEAYLGREDAASHAARGPTPRASLMFGVAGRLYVYFSYGMHHCANVVTDADGEAGAVLLRGARLTTGEEVARRRRLAPRPRRLASAGLPSRRALPGSALLSGPGNLCRGLGIAIADNGLDLCATASRITLHQRLAAPAVVAGRRVGIAAATELALRFAWAGDPAVSSPRLG